MLLTIPPSGIQLEPLEEELEELDELEDEEEELDEPDLGQQYTLCPQPVPTQGQFGGLPLIH